MSYKNTPKFRKGLICIGFPWLVSALVAMPGAAAASPTAEVAVTEGHANGQDEAAGGKSKMEQTGSAAARVEPTRLAMAQLFLGNAPYICTPSGFGNKARCFLRASVHLDASKDSRF